MKTRERKTLATHTKGGRGVGILKKWLFGQNIGSVRERKEEAFLSTLSFSISLQYSIWHWELAVQVHKVYFMKWKSRNAIHSPGIALMLELDRTFNICYSTMLPLYSIFIFWRKTEIFFFFNPICHKSKSSCLAVVEVPYNLNVTAEFVKIYSMWKLTTSTIINYSCH